MVGHAGARQVDDRRETRQISGTQCTRRRVPADLGGGLWLAADEVYDLVAPGTQEGRQRAANKTGSASDGNAPGHGEGVP
jgi:hypothetical protein